MGRERDNLSLKRKRPDEKSPSQRLSEAERKIYECIRSKEGLGIFLGDIKRETNLSDPLFKKSLKSLQDNKLVKEVSHYLNKGKKYFMAVEFEPADEVTGGTWYSNGSLDIDFINTLKKACSMCISKLKVATIEGILELIRKLRLLHVECDTEQIKEIVHALVLDNEVLEVRSTEMGDYANIPFGTLCYKPAKKLPKVGALTSIPCGVCPRIHECTPDGIISPVTCIYYTKWLDF